LGLEMAVDGYYLRFTDPATGRRLLTTVETARAFREEEAARKQEQAAREKAEREVTELRAELARLKQPSAPRRKSRK
ncbi:MAG: hypothetical protein HY719_00240, partial [Planctomycetes bacterium]|nr:hypothetical protein [Planctomycetota bacterium]